MLYFLTYSGGSESEGMSCRLSVARGEGIFNDSVFSQCLRGFSSRHRFDIAHRGRAFAALFPFPASARCNRAMLRNRVRNVAWKFRIEAKRQRVIQASFLIASLFAAISTMLPPHPSSSTSCSLRNEIAAAQVKSLQSGRPLQAFP